ncbi:MAG: L,D-transpeptidase [Pseudobdellovibrionaceae bacterium]
MSRWIVVLTVLVGSSLAHADLDLPFGFSSGRSIESLDMGHSVTLPAFDAAVFQDRTHWINEFEVVILINKSSKGSTKQSLVLYKNGVETLKTKVSTGREKIEKKRTLFRWHAPKKTYFSTTNTGFFGVLWMNTLHKSKLWGTEMPYAVFFDGGIAVHQAPEGTEGALGKRASGGCVRVSKNVASTIYSYIFHAGKGSVPQFTQTGEPKRDANGNIVRKSDYKTLIIVQDIQD